MSVPASIVVIGNGAGGLGAAAAVRAADPSARVTTCPSVTAIDLDKRTVEVEGQGATGWDRLIITEGSSAAPLAGVPTDLDGLYAGANLPASGEWEQVLADVKVAVVVDATPAGLEAVAALAASGIETHLVDPHPSALAGAVDAEIAGQVEESWAEMGVKAHFHTQVEEFLAGEARKVSGVRTSEGELPADLVVVCSRPAVANDVAAAAGLDVSAAGGIVVEERMATSVAGVWAAGECIDLPAGTARFPLQYLPSHFYAQGRVAGTNAAGGSRTYQPAYVPWALSAGRWLLGGVAYGETQATALGVEYVLGKATGISRARYYPDVKKVTVKLLAEPGSLRLIGAQMVGGEGIKERADFLGMAVRMGVTLTDLAFMENVYSPPIGALNEPIAVAAQNGLAGLAS
ncbi:MAG: FAD-dependent oxidoreductase [Acidimicrobiia bacterium]